MAANSVLTGILVWALVVSCCGQALAGPVFILDGADDKETKGTLEAIDDLWTMRLRADERISAAGASVVSVRRDQALLPPPPSGEQVILANGDRIAGEVSELLDERLRLRTSLAEVTLPLSTLSLLWLAVPDGADDAEMMIRRWHQGKRTHDTLFLRNGDLVDGTLTSLNRQEAVVEVAQKEVKLQFNKIAFIAFNSELQRRRRPQNIYGKLILDDGTRLTLSKATCDGLMLAGETHDKTKLSVPVTRIIALDMFNGCAVYLSDLKPTRYDFTAYLGGVRWPYVNDASVVGRGLCLAGSYYDKGLGMHTQSRITYDLGGAFRRFDAMVGLDDRTGRKGAARVGVLVDGKPQDLKRQAEITGDGQPRKIRVDVSGGKELTLVNEFGRFGDVQDHIDWADARLVK